jgi:hypothetical protein
MPDAVHHHPLYFYSRTVFEKISHPPRVAQSFIEQNSGVIQGSLSVS